MRLIVLVLLGGFRISAPSNRLGACVAQIWNSYSNSSCSSSLYVGDLAPLLDCPCILGNSSLADVGPELVVVDCSSLEELDVAALHVGGVIVVVHCKVGDIGRVFGELWRSRLPNAVAVTENLDAYTYRPYSQLGCKPEPVSHLGACTGVTRLVRESEVANFSGCNVAVAALSRAPFTIDGGFELATFEILAERLGLSKNVTLVNSITRSYEADVLLGGLPQYFLEPESVVLYYFQEELAFFTLLRQDDVLWRNTLRIFDPAIWAGLLATTICLSLLFKDSSNVAAALLVFSTITTCSRCSPNKFRWLFLLWTYAALILTSSYKSLLIASLFKSLHPSQITSTSEMMKLKYSFGTIHEHDAMFEGAQDPEELWQYYEANHISCGVNDHRCFKRLKKDKFAYFTFATGMLVLMDADKFYSVSQAATVWRGYVGLSVFDRTMAASFQVHMRHLDESGIIKFLDRSELRKPEDAPKFRKLTLRQLSFNFAVYAACILLSCMAFLIEFCCKS